jgi:hypothetical protein
MGANLLPWECGSPVASPACCEGTKPRLLDYVSVGTIRSGVGRHYSRTYLADFSPAHGEIRSGVGNRQSGLRPLRDHAASLITINVAPLVQPNQEDTALHGLRGVCNFFGASAIVILHSDAHPPVPDRTAKTQNFGGVITAGQAVRN